MAAWLAGLTPLAASDLTWLAQLASLLVLPFAHEDLAFVTGAYIVANDVMPLGTVWFAIYCGMIASDLALYAIGAGARHMPWLGRRVDANFRRYNDTDRRRNIFGLVALCRVVPGSSFVALVGCGWARVPLSHFAAAIVLVSAVYLPIMLCLTISFGDVLDDHIGLWAWPFLLLAIVVAGYARNRIFSFARNDAARARPRRQALF